MSATVGSSEQTKNRFPLGCQIRTSCSFYNIYIRKQSSSTTSEQYTYLASVTSSSGSVPQNHFSGQYDTIIAQKQKETLSSTKSQRESGAEAKELFEKKVEWGTQKYSRKKCTLLRWTKLTQNKSLSVRLFTYLSNFEFDTWQIKFPVQGKDCVWALNHSEQLPLYLKVIHMVVAHPSTHCRAHISDTMKTIIKIPAQEGSQISNLRTLLILTKQKK